MIDRRAVAMQGVGFGRRLLAFQGLRSVEPRPSDLAAGGSWQPRPKRKRRRQDDEEVLLFLIR